MGLDTRSQWLAIGVGMRKAEILKLHRPKAFAGLLIVGLLALVGFAAFSATGASKAPPTAIPDVNARVAGALLGIDLGPDPAAATPTALRTVSEPQVEAASTTPPPSSTTAAPPPTTEAQKTTPTTAPPPTAAPPSTTTTTTTTTARPPATTAAPTTTTTTTSYPPGVTFGVRDVEEWRPLVERYFPPERVEEALSVMECESQGNPLAQHPGSLATGLFQFIPNTWDWASGRAGWGGHSAFEPEANIASAAWLVEATITVAHPGGPWAHWTCQPAPAE